jgi:hypothetical protein
LCNLKEKGHIIPPNKNKKEMDFMEALIPLTAVGGFFTMIILLRSFYNKERMSMIEKGADASEFKGMYKGMSKSWVLVIAGLAIGCGLGIVIAGFLDRALDMEEFYPAMIFVGGGIGLIFGRKMANKEDTDHK